MKYSVLLRVVILGLLITLFIPVAPALADPPPPSPDMDGDGLSNALETGGWYSLAGGPFVTDPLDFDSDDDGLSDGEEKLFNTKPLDERDPGIYVRYQNDLKTRQYFRTKDPAYLSFVQGGDRYLMTEAVVARRGATLLIGGPAGANLQITGSGLTSLTPVKNTCRGGWTVTLPSNGTLGTYTATLSQGGWSKSMPLYVIFQLPTPSPAGTTLYNLSQASIDTFIYDDDPANRRDELSVWFFAPESQVYRTCTNPPNAPPCSDWAYHVAKGHAQAFATDQFKKSVFLNHATKAIYGQTSLSEAVNAVAAWADTEFRTDFRWVHYNFAEAMYRWNDGTGLTMDGGACQDNANVFTSMLRSAGIAARPFLIDYNKTPGHDEGGQIGTMYEYDHSVLVWVDGHWKAGRSWASGESSDPYYPWDYGYISHREVSDYLYNDYRGDLIVSANEGWDQTSKGGMANDVLYPGHLDLGVDGAWDYKWYSSRPLQIERSPYVDILAYESWYGDNWAPGEWRDPPISNPPGMTARETYYLPSGIPAYVGDLENWPYNPVPIGCSPSTPPSVCNAFLSGFGTLGLPPAEPPLTSAPPAASDLGLELSPTGPVQILAVTDDYGIDLDGNGRFDKLVIQLQVNVAQPGTYTFGGGLQAGAPHTLMADMTRLSLESGQHTVEISFDGTVIGRRQVDGPYQLAGVWVTDQEAPQPEEVEPLDYKYLPYLTAPYAADEFESPAALFAPEFQHQGLDSDGDGYYESLAVQIPLKVALPGTYTVEGDLYGGDASFIGHAVWTGSGPTATLQFEVRETSAPYTLENLTLLDAHGALLDSKFVRAYEIADVAGKVDQGALSIGGSRAQGDLSPMQVIPTDAFTTTVVDTNGNGRYDELIVKVGVNVTDTGGAYRIEGLLVDERNTPVAWSVSDPQTLDLGDQELELPFDGRIINDNMPFSPATQSFKLVAVKIFSGVLTPATLEEEVEVAVTTPAYTRDDFETTEFQVAIFEDDMENGAGQWTAESFWDLNDHAWHSYSHAWEADVSGNRTSNLTTIGLDLPADAGLSLRFRTCYAMQSAGDVGRLQASTDGSVWTNLASYTDSTAHWTTEFLDLAQFRGASSLQLRFKAASQSEVLWYIDDVALVGVKQTIYLPIVLK